MIESQGWVLRLNTKAGYQGLVLMVWFQGLVPRLYTRDGSKDIELLPNVWSDGLDPKVAYQWFVPKLSPKINFQGFIPGLGHKT